MGIHLGWAPSRWRPRPCRGVWGPSPGPGRPARGAAGAEGAPWTEALAARSSWALAEHSC
eukprot:11541530-Alexandrium_andersonii.AAC.1